jgi:uncharacterized 2Fe-2S/4Fe-4S cluster protein (DUF4445 family)
MSGFIVDINPIGLQVKAKKGQLLHEILLDQGVQLIASCGGKGKCGKCRVILEKGAHNVSEPNAVEGSHIGTAELEKGVRLACQCSISGNLRLHIPLESMLSDIPGDINQLDLKVRTAPVVKKVYLELPEVSLPNLNSDMERLLDSLKIHKIHPKHISSNALTHLPETIRSNQGRITATVWGGLSLIDVEKGNRCEDAYGIAIDLGTTKIAYHLISLANGEIIDTSGIINPQIPYGDDVLSRIHYAVRNDKARKALQEVIIETINRQIMDSCSKRGIDFNHIYEVTVACNTAMHHLFLRIFPKFLSESPYTPALRGSLDIKATELGLKINPEGNIHCLPLIAGFVGADCLADILVTGIYKKEEICLLLDIGTNSEVVLGNRDRILVRSCDAGPAFEGTHVKHGMRAGAGAINSVRIDQKKKKLNIHTINDSSPIGLCGSGIIECIVEMLKAGIIDDMGTFNGESGFQNIRVNEYGEWELVLVKGDNDSKDIVVTQKDINEIQLAKAAISSSISILMQNMRINPNQISSVFVAGAFGSTLDPVSAKSIGIFPDIDLQRIHNVGNAAINGAKAVLLSKWERRKCQKIAKQVEYIELADHPDFSSFYIPALRFAQ